MTGALSINGGGIRGIVPCSVLASLEQQRGKLTRDIFSYVAGTSTGALLAAGVAAGIPAGQLLDVYTTQSREIFTPTGAIADIKRAAEGYIYDPKSLERVLNNVFGSAASWTMNDSPIGICISATAANGHDWFFVRDGTRNARTTGTTKLIDAAVASACAPTYFSAWPLTVDKRALSFFDAGTGGLANPSYQACVEMFEYDVFVPAKTRLVSLGTGYYPAGNKPPQGLLATIGWATDTLVDTSEDWVDHAVRRQWPGVQQKFDWELPSDISMDDLSGIPALVAAGHSAAASIDWSQVLGV
ncbi:MAG TPA: patatin-like phospholipase family protein [Bryobacteraceae bacterium]|nr:patatin-like phospholipase family protein [Bryobacteraceae bacterium]